MIKLNSFLILIMIGVSYAHAMIPQKKSYPLLFLDSPLQSLSKEDKVTFDATLISAPTLSEAAFSLNQFIQINKEFHTFIQKNTLMFIKTLSFYFKSSHEKVAHALQTKKASSILLKQQGFARQCDKSIDPFLELNTSTIKKSNIDLNFTYEPFQDTQLLRACTPSWENICKVSLIKWLLDNQADFTILNIRNESAALRAIAISKPGTDGKYPIEHLIYHSSFDINYMYDLVRVLNPKKTTLLLSVIDKISAIPSSQMNIAQQEVLLHRLRLVQILCDRGANPQLKVGSTSAIEEAFKLNHMELIQLLQKYCT